MRENSGFAMSDLHAARALIGEFPWGTMASATPDGIVVSNYPFLVEEQSEDADTLTLLSHVGRPDERLHGLGESEIVVVFAGPHGYISPGWYGLSQAVPTWDYVTVHAYGIPEILSDAENLVVLEKLVEHFEAPLEEPFTLRSSIENYDYAQRIVHGTIGFRMRVTRWVGKNKMSQDKPAAAVDRVLQALQRPGPYRSPELAERIRAARPAVRD